MSEVTSEESLAIDPQEEPQPISAPLLTIYDLLDEISNENETDVLQMVYDFQAEEKLPCDCRECLLDITAVALNYLPPHYSVSIHRDMYVTPEAKTARQVEIEAAILHACEKVKLRPHH
jgi:competence protein ComFB